MEQFNGGPIEIVRMRMQTLRVESHRQQDLHFRTKIQLEEQLEENEVKLHFTRGVIEGIDICETYINEALTPVEIPSEVNLGQAMDVNPIGDAFPKTGDEVGNILDSLPPEVEG